MWKAWYNCLWTSGTKLNLKKIISMLDDQLNKKKSLLLIWINNKATLNAPQAYIRPQTCK